MSIHNVTTSPDTVNRNEMSTPLTFAQIANESPRVHLQASVNKDFPAEISLDDPRLTSEVLHENPDGDAYDRKKKLQHGLCYDDVGKLRVKPEIEQSLSPDRLRIANALLAVGDAAKANSFLACNLLQKIHGVCIDESTGEWHDTYITSTACDMPFLCAPCATPKARVRRFRHDYPYLFQHLMRSAFHVLTLTIADAPSSDPVVIQAQRAVGIEKLKQFTEGIDGDRPKSESGWKLLHALGQGTKFYVIYQGPKLPAWPSLNAQWQAIAGADATIRCKMFDGKDDDDQLIGLHLAFSGFADYHVHVTKENLVAWMTAFADFDTSLTYGLFRGFDAREEKWRAEHAKDEASGEPALVEMCEGGAEHAVPITCWCGKPIKHNPLLPLMTTSEILAKGPKVRIYFRHSTKAIYAKCGHVHNPRIEYRTLEADELGHAPPS
ncbi:MAG: hypothetical protein WB558_07815 [Terriglobales bacterium]